MTIINLYDINKNFEEIKLTSQKIFKFKNSYSYDLNNLFNLENTDTNTFNFLNYPLENDSSYGLLSLFPWKTNTLKEINGNTRTTGILSSLTNEANSNNLKFPNKSVFITNNNRLNLDKITPNVNNSNSTVYVTQQNKLEIDSTYFSIKRLQQELIPFSSVLTKKKIIKDSLYLNSTYSKSDSNYSQSLHYSFYNYNCFNFFNILPAAQILSNSVRSKLLNNSHKNIMIYSNKEIQSDSNIQKKISINNENKAISINFWINPRRTSSFSKKYNPGCILHIPNILGIYLIPAAESYILSPTTFKICCLYQLDANKLIDSNNITRKFITSTTIDLNTWNNFSIILNESKLSIKTNDIVETFSLPVLTPSYVYFDPPIITIGNRFRDQNITWANNIRTNFFNDENYLKKHLNQNEIESYVNNNFINQLNTTIYNINDQSFSASLQSQALNAEIYGLMIFNDEISLNKLNNYAIGKNNPLENIFLSFYLPCVYLSDLIRREGYITLGTRDNIAYRSCVNPYFAHKVYGHELSIESFVRDVVNLRLPFLMGFDGDEYDNSLTTEAYNNLTIQQVNKKYEIVKDFILNHKNTTQVMNKIMNTDLFSVDLNFSKGEDKFQFNNLIYRNNFILPCDNGKSNINLNNIFNLQRIKNLLDTSIFTFYVNENPHYVSLNTLFHNDNEYTYYFCKDFFNNDNVFNLSKKYLKTDGAGVIKNDYVSKLLIDKNNTKHIKNFTYIESNFTLEGLSGNNINKNFFGNMKNENNNKFLLINSIFKNVDEKYNAGLNSTENKIIPNISKGNISYKAFFNSHYSIEGDLSETHSVLFDISNLFYSSKIRPKTIEIQDIDLSGTGGALNIKLKDNGRSLMYRADCIGKHATWAYTGHAFYADGLVNVLHPGLSNFGENNFIFKLNGEHSLYTFEINVPVEKNVFTASSNKTYKKDLRPSANLSDLAADSFVYITGVNLHDESMNIVAKANFAQPIVKRTNDRYNIRLKMDF